jgi:phosphatidylserine/phosphatidylglycerophosphate/cardiolipin synthase-like enzyme
MFGLFRGGLKSFALLAGAALFVVLLFHDAIARALRKDPVFQQSGRLVQQGQKLLRAPTMHFAPDENLERFDIEQLRVARARLDISMYAFTDRELAQVLKQLARRGSVIRLYRDQEQFESEQAHSYRGHPSTTDLLRGAAHIHIRVKGGLAKNLMHQKDYCVDCADRTGTLREGSANWSLGAERFQDNALWFTSDPREIEIYERKFDEMWNRPSNRILQ